MGVWESLRYAMGSGFTKQFAAREAEISQASVNYGKKKAAETGDGYLPGAANDYYGVKVEDLRKQYAATAKRRTRKKMDYTDEVIQSIANSEKGKTAGVSGASTLNMNFLGAPLLDEPSLVSRTILG